MRWELGSARDVSKQLIECNEETAQCCYRKLSNRLSVYFQFNNEPTQQFDWNISIFSSSIIDLQNVRHEIE